MKILDRYIGKVVAISILGALSVLLAFDLFLALLRELDEVGQGQYTMTEVFIFLILSLPKRIYTFFPMAALLGSIVGLGLMASNSELTVIRAAGVSLMRIVGSLMKVGVIMLVVVVLIGEIIAPYTEKAAENRRSVKISDQITLQTKYGFWARDGISYINIRDIKYGGDIGDIYIYEFDDQHRLRVSTYARYATYEDDKWLLQDIVQSRITSQGVKSQRIARAVLEDTLLDPGLLDAVIIRPQHMSIWNLHQYINYLHSNGQTANRFQLAYWTKIFAPISMAVMIFLAAPFVFGPLRSVGVGARILVGTLFGIGFHIINKGFSNLGIAYDLNPVMSALAPSLLFLVIAVVMMRRVY